MRGEIDWEAIPEAEYEAYKRRLEIVELILDAEVDSETTKRLRQQYCEENGCRNPRSDLRKEDGMPKCCI
jgi:hypothetical protein